MLEDLIITAVIPGAIGAFLAGIGIFLSATRNRAWAAYHRLQSLSTLLGPEEALKNVIRFAQHYGYKISAFNETAGRVVLEESASLFTWGFLFQVLVLRKGDGSAVIEVDTRSRLIQVGPLLSRHHERCVNGIRASLYAAT